MKIDKQQVMFGLVAALVLAISSARADEGPVGKVRGIYTQVAEGVWMEGARAGKAAWVDVEFGARTAERRRILARVPAELAVQAGDLVEIQLAAIKAVGPVREPHRAAQIAAKWFTPRAAEFDAEPRDPAARRTASLF